MLVEKLVVGGGGRPLEKHSDYRSNGGVDLPVSRRHVNSYCTTTHSMYCIVPGDPRTRRTKRKTPLPSPSLFTVIIISQAVQCFINNYQADLQATNLSAGRKVNKAR